MNKWTNKEIENYKIVVSLDTWKNHNENSIIGGALQRSFTDAVARLQSAANSTGRTVRVGAAGQHAGTCNGNSGKSGIFHKVTAGECIGHVRSSFKKQISTALRHYL